MPHSWATVRCQLTYVKLVKNLIRLSSLFVQIVSGAHPSTLAIHHHLTLPGMEMIHLEPNPHCTLGRQLLSPGGLAACEYLVSIYQVHNSYINNDGPLSRQEAKKGPGCLSGCGCIYFYLSAQASNSSDSTSALEKERTKAGGSSPGSNHSSPEKGRKREGRLGES